MGDQGARLFRYIYNSTIEVRPIRYNEIDTYTSCWRVYGLYNVYESYLLEMLHTNISDFIAAFYRGEMVGTCWDISPIQERRCIGALTVDPRYPNALTEMIAFVRRRYHPNMVFDVNIPISLCYFFRDLGWTSHWDVRLYTSFISCLELIPLEKNKKYRVEHTVNCSSLFHHFTPSDIQREIPRLANQTSALHIEFDIYQSDNLVGYVSLRKAGENIFVIGPVIARDTEAAVFAMKNMLSYITNNYDCGYLATYVLKNHVTYRRFLVLSGFQSSGHEWKRCSLNETTYVNEQMTYEHSRNTVFSLDCIMLCGL